MNEQINCQLQTMTKISTGKAGDYHPPLKKRIKRIFSKHLSPHFKHELKLFLFDPKQWFRRLIRKQKRGISSGRTIIPEHSTLKIGDMVRVRSKEEIRATLDRWGQLKGCSFIDEMSQYCCTIQEVFKPVHRFVDERDQNVKRTKGVVLLKNVLCQGTNTFGMCDRSCFYFWREEWLEKI